jgi:Carboxypeptidase regulatory-like domain
MHQFHFLDTTGGNAKVIATRKAILPTRAFGKVICFIYTALLLAGIPALLAGSKAVLADASPLVIKIRRDTSQGGPADGFQQMGISDIIWGSAPPGSLLVVRMVNLDQEVVRRTITANADGDFAVSMDENIQAGYLVQIETGSLVKSVSVPEMSAMIDAQNRLAIGQGPANIHGNADTLPSLALSLGGSLYYVNTSSSGEFTVDLIGRPYLAGLLGAMIFTSVDGDQIFQPFFIADRSQHGFIDDWRADVVLGQPDFYQITPNEVTANHVFNPGGVLVDRTVQPNRIYLLDAGNSRILGFSALGVCSAGPQAAQACTANSDCPESSCQLQPDRPADLVIGQPDFNSSKCNGDSSFDQYPDLPMAGPDSLCSIRAEQVSPLEAGSSATMAVDGEGNLYVNDQFNNRVLRFNDPFNQDSHADAVWGQANFSGMHCNRGAGYDRQTSADSLCLGPKPNTGDEKGGVALDAHGDLWVSDTNNNRVMRFPWEAETGAPASVADLVLGQPDFTSVAGGAALNQMHKPSAVRLNSQGVVYVVDSLNRRVLVFEPPYTSGMPASRTLPGQFDYPVGIEIGLNDEIWINDMDRGQVVRFVDETPDLSISTGEGNSGGIGIDQDGDIFVSVSGDRQEAYLIHAPTFEQVSTFLKRDQTFNKTGESGLAASNGGLEVSDTQLIYSDGGRLLFWNQPDGLVDYQPADGLVGQPDFSTNPRWSDKFARMRIDAENQRLWVIHGDQIEAYLLPLMNGALPDRVLASPLPLLGGGEFNWGSSTDNNNLVTGGIAIQPNCADCLWIAEENANRAFRIRNAYDQPFVDVVLGQLSPLENQCNMGRGLSSPGRETLCHPGGLEFDAAGNLFLADHNLEYDGNWRLLEWDTAALPVPTGGQAMFAIPADRVFGRNGSFTDPYCQPYFIDPLCAPFEPAFDPQGRMGLGFNSYLGSPFPLIYPDPLKIPYPVAALGDLYSMPVSMRFNSMGNLFVADHNRARILIYRRNQSYAIQGTIRTDTGANVEDVRVDIRETGKISRSDSNGFYAFYDLPVGIYQLEPSADRYTFEPSQSTVQLSANMAGVDFTAKLKPIRVNGRVHFGSGEPLAGVRLRVLELNTWSDNAEDGTYQLVFPIPGRYTIQPEHAEYNFSPSYTILNLNADVAGINFLASARTYFLGGTVKDVDGQPLMGIQITLLESHEQAYSGADGTYLFSALLPGEYTVRADFAGYQFNPSTQTVTLAQDTELAQFTGSLLRYHIQGTISDERNDPLGGVNIKVMETGNRTVSNANGVYVVSNVLPGSYTLVPEKDGYIFKPDSRQVQVLSDQFGLDFQTDSIGLDRKICLPVMLR